MILDYTDLSLEELFEIIMWANNTVKKEEQRTHFTGKEEVQ